MPTSTCTSQLCSFFSYFPFTHNYTWPYALNVIKGQGGRETCCRNWKEEVSGKRREYQYWAAATSTIKQVETHIQSFTHLLKQYPTLFDIWFLALVSMIYHTFIPRWAAYIACEAPNIWQRDIILERILTWPTTLVQYVQLEHHSGQVYAVW